MNIKKHLNLFFFLSSFIFSSSLILGMEKEPSSAQKKKNAIKNAIQLTYEKSNLTPNNTVASSIICADLTKYPEENSTIPAATKSTITVPHSTPCSIPPWQMENSTQQQSQESSESKSLIFDTPCGSGGGVWVE